MVKIYPGLLEAFAAHIDGLIERDRIQIWSASRASNASRVAIGIAGGDPGPPKIPFSSGVDSINALFFHIIDPERITGRIRRGGREYECNLIYDDIFRNGLGVNQYEAIAKEARRMILVEHVKQVDLTGDSALRYLEMHALDVNLRRRARRDWVEFLGEYAHKERITRDPEYVTFLEILRLFSDNIDVKAVRAELPSAVDQARLYEIAVSILNYELAKAQASGDNSDYCIRSDLIPIFMQIGTQLAMEIIRERYEDPNEHDVVKKSAAQYLGIKSGGK